MNGKKAKQLRKLADLKRGKSEVVDVPMKNVLIKRFHKDGSIEDVDKTRTTRKNKTKEEYNKWKKAYYILKQKGKV